MKLKTIDLPIEQIQQFCDRWQIMKFSLFGSVLRDDFRPDSDIDVLVEFQPGHIPRFLKLHQIQEELSSILGNRQIDLVTPKSLNHRIRDRILAESEVHYVAEG